MGAGVNGTLNEFGIGLGVAVLGAVLNARFAALIPVAASSLPAAPAPAKLGGRARTDHGRVRLGSGDQSAGGRGGGVPRRTAGRGVAPAGGTGRLRGDDGGVGPA